jgi:ABC-type uncharacterized transport system auxiliary subunit
MRWFIVLSTIVALAGCVGARRGSLEIAHYDFGPPASPVVSTTQLPLHDVEVVVPSWLDTPQLQYRLMFADATQRRSYAESRWVAPPGELLEALLRRQLMDDGHAPANGGCRLRVDLDELLQIFHTPQRSEGLIELQVSLVTSRGAAVVARNKFAVAKPAATADARGGVDAVSAAARSIAQRLQDWLNGLDRRGAGRLDVAKVCAGS